MIHLRYSCDVPWLSKRHHTNKAEISCLENAGRLPASAYDGATMYTTLSPCDMCTGACVLYKVKRVVVGENKNFVGGEQYLQSRGIEVAVLQNKECIATMDKFIREKPELWYALTLLCFASWRYDAYRCHRNEDIAV